MANHEDGSSVEPTKIETSASDACTRSGVFALLLTVICFLLIPYWRDRKNEIALKRYVADRLNLATTVETIAEGPTWRNYIASHPEAVSIPIAQLLDKKVEMSRGLATIVNPDPSLGKDWKMEFRDQSHAQSGKLKKQHASVTAPVTPSPPTNLRAYADPGSWLLDYMPQIAELLTDLNNPDVLSRSRRVSKFFDFSIVRWSRKRGNIIYRNAFSHVCTPTKEIESLEQDKKSAYDEFYVPRLNTDVMQSCLTFPDVQELAQFELPTLTNPTQLGSRNWTEIELSPGALPRDPYMATLVVEILMFFALIHFGAYAKEAVSSSAFPARATLFGAFSNPPQTLLVILLALWCPLVASLGIALTSLQWPFWLCSALIFYAVLSIHIILQTKSYFLPLSLRRLSATSMWRSRTITGRR